MTAVQTAVWLAVKMVGGLVDATVASMAGMTVGEKVGRWAAATVANWVVGMAALRAARKGQQLAGKTGMTMVVRWEPLSVGSKAATKVLLLAAEMVEQWDFLKAGLWALG